MFIYWGNEQAASSAHDITFDRTRIAVGRPTTGPSIEAYDTRRLTIKNSTIGPACCGNDENGNAAGSPVGIRLGVADVNFPLTRDAVIDNNLIRGITRNCAYWLEGYGSCPQSNCTAEDLCHADAIQIWGATNTTITRNRIYNNEVQAIFFDPTAPLTNGLLENNLIGGRDRRQLRHLFRRPRHVRALDDQVNTLQGTAQIRVVNVAALRPERRSRSQETSATSSPRQQTTGTDCHSGAAGAFTYAYNAWAGAGSSSTNCGATDTVARPTFVDARPGTSRDDGSAARTRVGGDQPRRSGAAPLRATSKATCGRCGCARMPAPTSARPLCSFPESPSVPSGSAPRERRSRRSTAGASSRDGGRPRQRRPPIKSNPTRIAYYRVHGGRLWVIYASDVVVGGGTTSPFYSTPAGLGVGAETARIGEGGTSSASRPIGGSAAASQRSTRAAGEEAGDDPQHLDAQGISSGLLAPSAPARPRRRCSSREQTRTRR